MDLRDNERWFDLPFDELDLPELGDLGEPPPPAPPDEGGGEGPGGGHDPAADAPVFSPWMTALVTAFLSLSSALVAITLNAGARGGPGLAFLLSILYLLLFVVPFLAGAIWFGRHRDGPRR